MTVPCPDDVTPILNVRDLSISFKMYDRRLEQRVVPTIRRLSATIHPGKMLAVVGASGSGKSLLAHAILGILPANASVGGEMEYCGETLTPALQKKLRGREIALVPQSVTSLDPLMRIKRQLCIPGIRPEDVTVVLRRYGLGEEEERLYPFQLSGGMARRALVSTAVVLDPKLVIADEPTPGLTRTLANEAMMHFKELTARGCAVMLITHDLDLAFRYADDVTIFYEGTTVETLSASDFGRPNLDALSPYCRALWHAIPQNDFTAVPQRTIRRMLGLPGDPPFARISGDRPDESKSKRQEKATLPAEETDRGLVAEKVGFRYGGRRSRFVLENVDLRIAPGERVGLLGPSGCGKSTLGKLLAGYLIPTGGRILLDGKPLPRRGYSPVQLIYQHPEQAVDPNRKMRETLCEGWLPDAELLENMEIEQEWLNRWPLELSGGQLQRFCIVRALGPETRYLIADEISTMLDVITQAQIWRALLKIVEERRLGLLMITHNEALAEKTCTRIVRFPADDAQPQAAGRIQG